MAGWKIKCADMLKKNINKLYEDSDINKKISNVVYSGCATYPQQPDVVNCGIYMLLGIDYYVKDINTKFNFDITTVMEYKAKIRKYFKACLFEDYNKRQSEKIILEKKKESFDEISDFST